MTNINIGVYFGNIRNSNRNMQNNSSIYMFTVLSVLIYLYHLYGLLMPGRSILCNFVQCTV